MRNLILAATAAVLAAALPQTDARPELRYRDTKSRVSLTMTQDIEATEANMRVAGRSLDLGLTLAPGGADGDVAVTIDTARAVYDAHGMEQRLGTRHLQGKSFELSSSDEGRRLDVAGSAETTLIHLDPMAPDDFSVAELVGALLPRLPGDAVTVGSTWTTERPVRSLEGWSWGAGKLTSRHEVTAIEEEGGLTIVTVETRGSAKLTPGEGERSFTGDMKQTGRWSFDATNGRILSLSIQQETQGRCQMPQGETGIAQKTRIDLSPGS